jgi:cytochrome c1
MRATCSSGRVGPPTISRRRSRTSRPRVAANGGAAPPDLSLITKARSYKRGFPMFLIDFFTQYQEQGPDYVAALLQGYEDKPPAGFTLPEGSYYNTISPATPSRCRSR